MSGSRVWWIQDDELLFGCKSMLGEARVSAICVAARTQGVRVPPGKVATKLAHLPSREAIVSIEDVLLPLVGR